MKFVSAAFTPTSNRRLNELVGFLLFVSALLLFLALGSYSPLDPSLNTVGPPPELRAPRNWIGMAGATTADLLLQLGGIAVFLLPGLMMALAVRWFFSRKIESPVAKLLGGTMLLAFVPALLALLPWHWRWLHVIPLEGLVGRIVGDALIHWLNLTGAYIVCATLIAVALYLSTTFSFGAVRLWFMTRFAFAFAAWDRLQDWRTARAKAKAQKELEKRRETRPAVMAQLVPAKRVLPPPKTGIEKMVEEAAAGQAAVPEEAPRADLPDIGTVAPVAVTERADSGAKTKTTMPKIAGSYKMPSSALLVRPDDHSVVDEEELKNLAEVLTRKCGEFEVHGQVTQINPGPVVTTFEFKPEAGIKYSRITGLTDDLCLGLRAESILIERMPGKSTVGVQVPNREREVIRLREVVESPEFAGSRSKLTLALGKDINGRITVADLATMPHLLIAGSTGGGQERGH